MPPDNPEFIMSNERNEDILSALRVSLEKNPNGVLEDIAVRNGVSTRTVLDCLPAACCVTVPGTHFETAMTDVAGWGEVTFLVHTRDVILEYKGTVPPGRFARGFYNMEGGTLGGHLRAENCATVYFVRRPFMKLDSAAVWFVNRDGEPMFKIFVGRNPDRSLKVDQIACFEALRDRLAKGIEV